MVSNPYELCSWSEDEKGHLIFGASAFLPGLIQMLSSVFEIELYKDYPSRSTT